MTCVVLLVIVGTVMAVRSIVTGPRSLSYSGLQYKYGVYDLQDVGDIPSAAAAGIELAVSGVTSPAYGRALRSHGVQQVDPGLQHVIYRTQCPKLIPASCAQLNPRAKKTLLTDSAARIKQVRIDPNMAGYYVLDDYWTDMRTALALVHDLVRSLDPGRPVVCGFPLTLDYRASDGRLRSNVTKFQSELRNYSPLWCDAVMIYAYGPPETPANSVDWSMRSILPRALLMLRLSGWDSPEQPLLGGPQAFGYRQAYNAAKPYLKINWAAPSAAQLATEVSAFCKYGASSILAYAWHDSALGNTAELYNSDTLRSGMRRGVTNCRQNYWPTVVPFGRLPNR